MNGTKLPVLQSGFVALSEIGFVLPKIEEQSLVKTIQQGVKQDPLAGYFYSPEVDELFNAWMNDVKVMSDFNFRERVLKTALTVFKTNNLLNWLEIQLKYSYTGNLHREFLQSTLQWVSDLGSKQERSVGGMQWLSLLKPETERGKLNDVYNESIEQTVKRWGSNIFYSYSSFNINTFVNNWVINAGGYEDMLICLQVIFGRRGKVARTA